MKNIEERYVKLLLTITICLMFVLTIIGTVNATNITENDSINIGEPQIKDTESVSQNDEAQTITNSRESEENTLNEKTIDSNDTNNIKTKNNINTIIIKGQVLDCVSDNPFENVNIQIKDLQNNTLINTVTNNLGYYTATFESNETVFNVLATANCHMPTLKRVETIKSDDGYYYGSTLTRLGSPAVYVPDSIEAFISEPFTYTIEFDNTHVSEIGYAPVVQLLIPFNMSIASAKFLNTIVHVREIYTNYDWKYNANVFDEFLENDVTVPPRYRLIDLEYPLGSFTPDETPVSMDVVINMNYANVTEEPQKIYAIPWFRLGTDPSGNGAIKGENKTTEVQPLIMKLIKDCEVPEGKTVTGENFEIIYTLTVDVSDGKTITNPVILDKLDPNLKFLRIDSGSDSRFTLSNPNPGMGDTLKFEYIGNITGTTSSSDIVLRYVVYAPEYNSTSEIVLDNTTGKNPDDQSERQATNSANITASFLNSTISDGNNADSTKDITLLPIQEIMSVSSESDNVKPGDLLNYNVDFKISDFFQYNQLNLTVTLGDGQTFNDTIHPKLTLNMNGTTYTFEFNDTTYYTFNKNSETGETEIIFNISDALKDEYGLDYFTGGLNESRDDNRGPTTGSLTFSSNIDLTYIGDKYVGLNDHINANSTLSGTINPSNKISTDADKTSISLKLPVVVKEIVAINGIPISEIQVPEGEYVSIKPGDAVTYLITTSLPFGVLNNLTLNDYLPMPIMDATTVSWNQSQLESGFPEIGQARIGPNDTLYQYLLKHPGLHGDNYYTFAIDSVDNKLMFIIGTFHEDFAHLVDEKVQIIFTVATNDKPFDDGLYLANLVTKTFSNNFKEDYQASAAVDFILQEPKLEIKKGINDTDGSGTGLSYYLPERNSTVPDSDLYEASGNDIVTFVITLQNTGSLNATNITVNDTLGEALKFVDGTIKVWDEDGPRSFSGNLFNGGLLVDGFLKPNGVLYISYNCTIDPSEVYYGTEIPNIASIVFYSSEENNYHNFVTGDNIGSHYSDSAKVIVSWPKIFDKHVINSSESSTKGNDLTIGETCEFMLDVVIPVSNATINYFTIVDTPDKGLVLTNGVDSIWVDDSRGKLGDRGVNYTISIGADGSFTIRFNTVPNLNSIASQPYEFKVYYNLTVVDSTDNNASKSSTNKTNIASINIFGPKNETCNSSKVSLRIVEPNVRISKHMGDTREGYSIQNWIGDETKISFHLYNSGDSDAFNVTVIDTFDSKYFDFNSFKIIGNTAGFDYYWDNVTGTIIFANGTIPKNTTDYIALRFSLKIKDESDIRSGTQYNNTVNLTCDSLNTTTTPNDEMRSYFRNGSTSAILLRVSDLLITKTNESELKLGESIVYNLTITNNGRHAGENIIVRESIPVYMYNVTYSLDKVNWLPLNGDLTAKDIPELGNLAVGGSITIFINMTLNATAQLGIDITNKAMVLNTTTADSNRSNNNDSLTLKTNQGDVDLYITETLNSTEIIPGTKVVYKVEVGNLGPATAINSTVLNPRADDYLTNPEYSLDGEHWFSYPNEGYLIPALSKDDEPIVLYLRYDVDPSFIGELDNPVEVKNHTNFKDLNLTNNNANLKQKVTPVADIYVIKNCTTSAVGPGTAIQYNITIGNKGPSYSYNITLKDMLNDNITNPIYSLNGADWAEWTGTLKIQSLANNTEITLLINGTIDRYTTLTNITNKVNVTSETPDNDTTNNNDSIDTKVSAADIFITKICNSTIVGPGKEIIYNITIGNNGPGDAYNITVTDIINENILNPTYMIFGEDTEWHKWNGTYIRELLKHNEVITLLINGTIYNLTTVTNITNSVNVTSTTIDTNTSNNNASIDTEVPGADIYVTKECISSIVGPGKEIIYKILIGNKGPSDSYNITLEDVLNENILNPICSLNGVDWAEWTGTLKIPCLIANNEITLLINGTIYNLTTVTNITNSVNVTSTTIDTNTSNNNASIDTEVPGADIYVTKTIDQKIVHPGDEIRYIITIANDGPSDSYNITVTDILDEDILNPMYSLNNGIDWAEWTGNLTIERLNNNTNVVIVINGTVNRYITVTNITNSVNVTSTTNDTNTLNNNDSVDTEVVGADIFVIKSANPEFVYDGLNITYTLIVGNNGPSESGPINITDMMPIYVSNAEFSLDGVDWEVLGDIIAITSLKNGQNITVFIRGVVNNTDGKNLTNTVKISSEIFDPFEENNTDSVNSTLKCADIAVKVDVTNKNPNYLDIINYTITIKNNGPHSATGVSIDSTLPDGVKLVSYDSNKGTYLNGLWDIGDLKPGESCVLILTSQVISSNTSITAISIKASENEYDPVGENNKDNVTISVDSAADLSIIKSASVKHVTKNKVVRFTIIVKNNGPNTAYKVNIREYVPKGLSFISYNANKGVFKSSTGIWSIPNLNVGESAKIVITFKVTSVGKITNKVDVNSSTYDPISENNCFNVTVDATKKVEPKPVHKHRHKSCDNEDSRYVPMQKTGVPIYWLVLALVMLVAGFVLPKRSKK